MNIINIKFNLTTETATSPQKRDEDLGIDFFADQDVVIPPGEIAKISSGVQAILPPNIGLVAESRSSCALRGLVVEAGVIDPGYRGIIVLLMRNCTREDITVKIGEKIVQFLPVKRYTVNIESKRGFDEPDTVRGLGGFGSTNST